MADADNVPFCQADFVMGIDFFAVVEGAVGAGFAGGRDAAIVRDHAERNAMLHADPDEAMLPADKRIARYPDVLFAGFIGAGRAAYDVVACHKTELHTTLQLAEMRVVLGVGGSHYDGTVGGGGAGSRGRAMDCVHGK